ncbi:DUF6011 domain-containing protein [Streptomyces acidiscabies]|uniref:DUF6011 domain-containing protein n=1 Tax=Streptomyces acidiscabies TaxID=42234 RepID=UPI00351BBB91
MRTCALCGRGLRTPESRAVGMGPACARKLAVRAPRGRTAALGAPLSPRAPRAATGAHAAPIPGQVELPLQPMQPTLWSL